MKQLDFQKLDANITEIAQYDLEQHNVSGSSYLVYQAGKVYKKHFGVTEPNGQPVGDDTVFRLASMTKPVTAVATLLLIDRGLLSLADPVRKFLPEFEHIHVVTEDGVDHGETRQAVTIKHLLSHTSGFGSLKPANLTADELADIPGTIRYFVKAGLDFEPDTRQWYSAFAAFDVVAAIIEQVTGQDYEDFLQAELFAPCGMKDTTFLPTPAQWARMIPMHAKVNGENAVDILPEGCVFEAFPAAHKAAGAGLASTLADYARFADMLLHKGVTADGRRLMSEATFELMSRPQVTEEIMPGNQKWGLGVRVITDETYGVLPAGSFGWSGAYGTHFWVDPADDLYAVFMKNSRFDGGAGNQSACRFERAVHDAM